MGHCKDCKHWLHFYDDYGRKTNFCSLADGWSAALTDGITLVVRSDGHSDCEVKLETGPLFGCIHFNQKNSQYVGPYANL